VRSPGRAVGSHCCFSVSQKLSLFIRVIGVIGVVGVIRIIGLVRTARLAARAVFTGRIQTPLAIPLCAACAIASAALIVIVRLILWFIPLGIGRLTGAKLGYRIPDFPGRVPDPTRRREGWTVSRWHAQAYRLSRYFANSL
jgi:Na+/H+ antiporter NhaA